MNRKRIYKLKVYLIVNQLFIKMLVEEFVNYLRLYGSPYTIYDDILRKENHLLFALGWLI